MKKCESKIGIFKGKESVREKHAHLSFFLQPRIFDTVWTEGYQSDRCVIVKGDRMIFERRGRLMSTRSADFLSFLFVSGHMPTHTLAEES